MTDYQPIDCDTHSRYEEAIVLRRSLRLSWRSPSGEITHAEVQPVDVETTKGEEFLHAVDAAGNRLRLRLDQILSAHPIAKELQ
jgi:Rho-binding antiterminator